MLVYKLRFGPPNLVVIDLIEMEMQPFSIFLLNFSEKADSVSPTRSVIFGRFPRSEIFFRQRLKKDRPFKASIDLWSLIYN